VDLGAHELNTAEILDQTCLGSLSIYRGENVKLSARALKTNIPPQGPFSGFGLAQGFFAAERHASYIADLCGQNPAEWRKDNCLENWTLGMRLKESPPIHQLMDMAASMSGYYRKWASYALIMQSRRQNGWDEEKGENYRGIGIALGCQGSGLLYSGQEKGNYGIELTLEKDGSLEIGALVNSSSNDFIQIWAGIAAEILGIDPARVRINNKKDILNSGPSTASINITVLTKLVERSCLDIRKQRFRDPLPITVRRSYRPQKNLQGILPPPGRKILDASGFNNPSWAAAVVEVEIDQLEYIPRIRGAWMGIDCGKILDEEKARRSLRIQAIQALGWAYREQVTYSYGGISRDQFDAYDIPEPSDIPPINVDFMWNDSGEARGLGELPFSCLPAAFLQAASQAMDHHFQSIPLSSRDLWEAVKQKQEGNA
jgi:CO/xanthine dehydrogenase Mo-binding subunit